MSKLADAFTGELIDYYKAPRRNILTNFSAKTIVDSTASIEYYRERQVKVIAKFEYTGWIRDDVKAHPGDENEDYTGFLKSVRRQVVEDVFGEFRPMIYEMHTAMYDGDLTRVKTILAKLENQMFVVEK
jgi:hypothetical protein